MTDTRAYELEQDVVTVNGPDAGSFLQSLLSQDLDGIAVGSGAPALLLQPQGKLIATMVAFREADDTWWCITDAGAGGALATGLQRFLIRVKAEVVDASNDFASVAVRGSGAAGLAAGVTAEETRVVPARWRGEPAFDIVGSREGITATVDRLRAASVETRDHDDYEHARIQAGVPLLGVDIDERTIPQEAFLHEDAVSFTKGCFVGQELVCRIDTRGHVNRYLRKVHLKDASVSPGADVLIDEKVVGALTSVAGEHALAMVRREVEPPASVLVRSQGSGDIPASVEAL